MHDLIFRLLKVVLVAQRRLVLGMFSLMILGGVACVAQPSSLTPQTLSGAQMVKWISGPATVSLGEIATLEVPEGYRFADAAGARMLLQSPNNPRLRGVLKPDAGEWSVTLEFAPTGYVPPATLKWINASAILRGIQAAAATQNARLVRQGAPAITTVLWEKAPEYDAANASLAFAVRIGSVNAANISQSIYQFGRNGVLRAISEQKAKGTQVSIKELLSHVAFKEGQRYEDFQEGDKLSSFDTYQLITGDEHPMAPQLTGWRAFFFARKTILWWNYSMAAWLAMALGICVFVLVIYLIAKELRSINPERFARAEADNNGAEVKARKIRSAVNGTDASGRRRAFDYQKYYSDLMMQVSTRSYTGLPLKQTEEAVEPAVEASAADAQKGAASELIARQKDLIEEQRRLMQQQTKLIEERSKLIEEKNQLLAKQSEMLENNLL